MGGMEFHGPAISVLFFFSQVVFCETKKTPLVDRNDTVNRVVRWIQHVSIIVHLRSNRG